jgi:hypothetical protein
MTSPVVTGARPRRKIVIERGTQSGIKLSPLITDRYCQTGGVTSDEHRNELGEFLKTRRAELSLRTVGLPDNGTPRRVSGLSCVAQLRTQAAKRPDDARLAALVGELSMRDAQFRQWWGGPHTLHRIVGGKTFLPPPSRRHPHPRLGHLPVRHRPDPRRLDRRARHTLPRRTTHPRFLEGKLDR